MGGGGREGKMIQATHVPQLLGMAGTKCPTHFHILQPRGLGPGPMERRWPWETQEAVGVETTLKPRPPKPPSGEPRPQLHDSVGGNPFAAPTCSPVTEQGCRPKAQVLSPGVQPS